MNTDVKQNKELLLGHLGGILLLGWFMVSRIRSLNREMENRNCEKECRMAGSVFLQVVYEKNIQRIWRKCLRLQTAICMWKKKRTIEKW